MTLTQISSDNDKSTNDNKDQLESFHGHDWQSVGANREHWKAAEVAFLK